MPHAEPIWTDIGDGYGIYQTPDGLCSTVDSVILAHFAESLGAQRIIDGCSGTGIVAMILAKRQADAEMIGLELQPQLVDLAQASAARNGFDSAHLTYRVADLRQPPKDLAGHADLFCANPPFFKAGHGALPASPERRLARTDIALPFAALAKAAAYLLRQRGQAVFIHRSERLPEVMNACLEHKLQPETLVPIISRPGRDAKLFVLITRYEGRGAMRLAAPFYIENENGEAHPALWDCYRKEGLR